MQAFCGIDWAEDHHDVAVIDADGKLLSRARIGNDPAGLHRLLELLSDAGDTSDQPIPVAIETTRGLLVACLRTTRPVYAINPMAVARYRERYSVARAKSDHGDALVLANILRTDAAAHRPLPTDSERAQAVTVLARGQQDAVWACQQLANQLRSVLVGVLPGRHQGLLRQARGADQPRSPRRPGRRTHPDPRRQAHPSPAAGAAAGLAAGATSTSGPSACRPPSGPSGCTSRPWSNRPWASTPWPWWPSCRPPAAPPTSSPRPPPRPSAGTRMPG